MTTTEPRTDRVRDLIAELLVDDIGRQALVSVLLDDIAERTIRVRGVEVVDPFGRVRVEASASESAGEVRVTGISTWDHNDARCNFVLIGANEESEGADVYVSLWSGDEQVANLVASEAKYGLPGTPVLELEEYERTGEYGGRGKILTERTKRNTIMPAGVEIETKQVAK